MAHSAPSTSDEPLHWYVLNAIFGKELQTCQLLQKEEIECFVPMRYEIRCVKQKKARVLVPAVHNLVFVRATKHYLEDFKSRVPFTLYFMTRKENEHRILLTVPDAEMEAFIRVARMVEEDIHYFRPEEIHLEKGIRVRVHGGPFDGLEGYLLKVKGRRSKRIVVRLAGVTAVAAAEIKPDLIEVLPPSA